MNGDKIKLINKLVGNDAIIHRIRWSPNGSLIAAASDSGNITLWNHQTGDLINSFHGHTGGALAVDFSLDASEIISSGVDGYVRIWKTPDGTGKKNRTLLGTRSGHHAPVWGVASSPRNDLFASASDDEQVIVWNRESERRCLILRHSNQAWDVCFSNDGKLLASCSVDGFIRLWEMSAGVLLNQFSRHHGGILTVCFSPDRKYLASASTDRTVRIWDVESLKPVAKLEGHKGQVDGVSFSHDGSLLASKSKDGTFRIWRTDTFEMVALVPESKEGKWVAGIAFHPFLNLIATLDQKNENIRIWEYDREALLNTGVKNLTSTYTAARVLLVGDSGVGKTGLSNFLTRRVKVEDDKPIPSTDGAWATHLTLESDKKKTEVEQEIWLWDFAGQVDYRLVQQIFMEETAVAVLVFNPQSENPFESLGCWDNDLQKSARKPFAKLLVAARVDRGGLISNTASIKKFMQERGFVGQLHETSAKTGQGCDELREAIFKAVDWKSIAETRSPVLYHRLKQEILALRDRGFVLIRWAELKQRMETALQDTAFEPEELNTVIRLLAGPGMIRRLDFGEFILLRPEVLSRYAAAVVRKIRKHPQELGCIREDELLSGDLDYQDFQRLAREDEKVVLQALLEMFISQAWCLRQPCDGSVMLVFPSYFRRERTDQPSHPNALVTYRFDGVAGDIYSTLVVRLHCTMAFQGTELWRSAADFKTQTGAKLGFTLARENEGRSRLEIYFGLDVDENSQLLFLRYINDHLKEHGQNVVRLRHFFCGNRKCDSYGKQFTDQFIIDKALGTNGKGKVFCPDCGKPILLRDVIEEKFESPAVKRQARELEAEAQFVIDNESRELILVGHTFAIVAEAGQIYRGYTNSDHGIDGEIEFKDDQGNATGKRLYMQLKSGDSYLRKHSSAISEIFQIKNPRWADYWQQHAYSVMLVIRTSDGEIRWMDVSSFLKEARDRGKVVKRFAFGGEPFNVMSVRRLRDKILRKVS